MDDKKKDKDDFDKCKKAAEQGVAYEQYRLGEMYAKGYGVKQNYENAIEWYEKAAEQGKAYAQYRLGVMYYTGESVEKDYTKAFYWYEKAAVQGDPDAQYYLGDMYYDGHGVEQNYEKAREWYEKAAEQGNADAQCNLGKIYEKGYGVEQNYYKAKDWYEKAAFQDDSCAQYRLGEMYAKGYGVKQNYYKAKDWYEKAAVQGVSDAQCNLGKIYEKGYGVEQNYEKAREWYEKAAEQGNAEAQYYLGDMYEKGYGVEKNYEEARLWYEKAARQGNFPAQNKLTEIVYCLKTLFDLSYDTETINKALYDFKEALFNNCSILKEKGLSIKKSQQAIDVPFLRIYYSDYNPNATGEELRIGYLLSKDRSSVFLTLMWGKYNSVQNSEINSFIIARAKQNNYIKIDGMSCGDSKYNSAAVCFFEYKKTDVLSSKEIKDDLKFLCTLYEEVYNKFIKQREIHLKFEEIGNKPNFRYSSIVDEHSFRGRPKELDDLPDEEAFIEYLEGKGISESSIKTILSGAKHYVSFQNSWRR